MQRSYYQNTVTQFLADPDASIFGKLAQAQYAPTDQQKNAWLRQITLLKQWLIGIDGHLYFEFSIPRMGKRVDNLLIIQDKILVIEFKVGEGHYQKSAQDQTLDYCLDLQNFHEGSHHQQLIPILIATDAPEQPNHLDSALTLATCVLCNANNVASTLNQIISTIPARKVIDAIAWENSLYKPTPTIIEAAQALYKGHNVHEISRHDAGAINLSITAAAINRIIERSKTNNQKSICFLTGVPGAGKTLAGLNIANERLKADASEHSVFLSGNGPLVDVLREALTRDAVISAKAQGERLKRSEAERRAKAFIQNIHHFRDDNLKRAAPPTEKVVVFDEAQRAWQKAQVAKFMKTKKGIDNFNMSEPEYLISVMDRHPDWCTIICLIGGGQEINTGEAGVAEWISSIKNQFPHWQVYFSERILTETTTYLDTPVLIDWLAKHGYQVSELHLAVSLRAFRSEKIALFVQYLLDNQPKKANEVLKSMGSHYPIKLTRNLAQARRWLTQQAKGSERIGVIASSGARRLRAHGIDIKSAIEPANWFLNGKDDVRSSYYLEEVATEFDVQGLELDYTCVAWDINLYHDQGAWHYQNFKGTKWQSINQQAARNYLLNAYRVLLTRARQGMIIFVPEVDDTDPTRPKAFYDQTFAYLQQCGIECHNDSR